MNKAKKKAYRGTNRHILDPKKDGAKGGRVKSERKTKAVRFNAIQKCTPKCPYFPCPWQPISELSEIKHSDGRITKRKKGYCAMKEQSKPAQAKFREVMDKGKEGYEKVMRQIVAFMVGRVPKDIRETEVMLRGMGTVHQRLWGDKSEITFKDNPTIDIIKIMKEEGRSSGEKSA